MALFFLGFAAPASTIACAHEARGVHLSFRIVHALHASAFLAPGWGKHSRGALKHGPQAPCIFP